MNWLISTTITGFAGILALDVVSLTPTRYTLFVVPALGAALFGNLTSTWLAAIGGVLLGVFQSGAAGLTLQSWWPEFLPQAGVRQAVPLLVIVGFQFTRGHSLPVRATRLEERQPVVPQQRWWGIQIAIVVAFVIYTLTSGSVVQEGKLVTSLIAAILMLSSMVLIGYLGQISLASLTLAGVAAYLATKFASDGTLARPGAFVVDGPGLPDPLAMVCGIGIAVAAGILVSIPALRIRGLQLAVVTLAAALAANELILANTSLMGQGARSNVAVPPPVWFGQDVGVITSDTGLPSRTRLAIFALGWFVLILFAVVGLRRGATGRRFLAVRANERAAEAAGVDVTSAKRLGFGISSGIAGVAGMLTAYSFPSLQVTTWDALAGLNNVALLFLGGVTRIGGALLGGFLAPGGIASETSSDGRVLRVAVSGMAMIAVAIFRSDGLTSIPRSIVDRARRRLTIRSGRA